MDLPQPRANGGNGQREEWKRGEQKKRNEAMVPHLPVNPTHRRASGETPPVRVTAAWFKGIVCTAVANGNIESIPPSPD